MRRLLLALAAGALLACATGNTVPPLPAAPGTDPAPPTWLSHADGGGQ